MQGLREDDDCWPLFGFNLFDFNGAFCDQCGKCTQCSKEGRSHESNRCGTRAKGKWDFQHSSAFVQNTDAADITLVDKLSNFIYQLTAGDGIFFGGHLFAPSFAYAFPCTIH
jgi:hypothetical protein